MDALKRLATAALMLVATPAHADEVGRWTIYIEEASARFGAQCVVAAIDVERAGHAR